MRITTSYISLNIIDEYTRVLLAMWVGRSLTHETVIEAQPALIQMWKWQYNTIRLHSALEYRSQAPVVIAVQLAQTLLVGSFCMCHTQKLGGHIKSELETLCWIGHAKIGERVNGIRMEKN